MSNKAETEEEEEEIWRVYPDYPFIEASNLGRVRMKDHYVMRKNGRKQFVKGHVLKQWLLPNGYLYVFFDVNGKRVHLRVHRAVATSFLPNPDNLPEINHKDNDPTNNVVSNLEWCSHQYNQDYKKNFGTSPTEVLGQPVIAVNIDTSEVFWFESQHEAARQLGVSQGNVSEVTKGKRHTTGGYYFCHADEHAVENVREKFGDDVAEKVEKLINRN